MVTVLVALIGPLAGQWATGRQAARRARLESNLRTSASAAEARGQNYREFVQAAWSLRFAVQDGRPPDQVDAALGRLRMSAAGIAVTTAPDELRAGLSDLLDLAARWIRVASANAATSAPVTEAARRYDDQLEVVRTAMRADLSHAGF